jgi:hypothetical protein
MIIIALLSFFCICLNYLVVFPKTERKIEPLRSRVEEDK